MLKIKHLMEPVERDDGKRLWVEPFGLTTDLREWCKVDCILTHLGPPMGVWQWFQDHPQGYDYFRAVYHNALTRSPYRPALQELSCAAGRENFTLVHQGDDPQHNTGTALYEFLAELSSYCPPEA